MLADLPEDEPHNAECGACHNPHVQTSSHQAVQSCANAGCHAQPDTLTPFHRGLNPGVLDNCVECHQAHTFRIHDGGRDCLDCHEDIYDDIDQRRISLNPATARPIRVASAGPMDPGLARLALAAHSPAPAAARLQAVPDTVRFWHGQHRGVECTNCHTMAGQHGALTVTSIADCRSCHHAEPVAGNCTHCHERPEMLVETFHVQRTFNLSAGAGRTVTRELAFHHEEHLDLGCATCHNTGGLSLQGSNVDCRNCHEQHHNPNADCKACHTQPPAGVHNLDVHLGCAGAGCHEAAPASVKSVPRTRPFCLVCHQDKNSHRPGRSCEQCHVLPRPRTASGPAPDDGPQLAEVP
jgi:hypothetical protein